jgi:hypothetical protein
MQYLRSYGHMAEKEHWCDKCCDFIHPGESYSAQVFATDNHHIVIIRQHTYPFCEPPEDPVDETRLSNRLERELKKAA